MYGIKAVWKKQGNVAIRVSYVLYVVKGGVGSLYKYTIEYETGD
jgi:hypothetical protein